MGMILTLVHICEEIRLSGLILGVISFISLACQSDSDVAKPISRAPGCNKLIIKVKKKASVFLGSETKQLINC